MNERVAIFVVFNFPPGYLPRNTLQNTAVRQGNAAQSAPTRDTQRSVAHHANDKSHPQEQKGRREYLQRKYLWYIRKTSLQQKRTNKPGDLSVFAFVFPGFPGVLQGPKRVAEMSRPTCCSTAKSQDCQRGWLHVIGIAGCVTGVQFKLLRKAGGGAGTAESRRKRGRGAFGASRDIC